MSVTFLEETESRPDEMVEVLPSLIAVEVALDFTQDPIYKSAVRSLTHDRADNCVIIKFHTTEEVVATGATTFVIDDAAEVDDGVVAQLVSGFGMEPYPFQYGCIDTYVVMPKLD